MKSTKKRLFALLLSLLVLAGVLGGCTTKYVAKSKYATTVVAEYNGQEIMLAEANFMAVMSQYSYEQTYYSYFGVTDIWDTALSDDMTMEESVKADVMAALLQTTLLCSMAEEYGVSLSDEDKEAVEEQIEYFLENAGSTLIERTGADEELLRTVYTNNALANRVWEYMTEDIDTTAEPEDYRRTKISYLLLVEPSDSTTADSEEEEAGEEEETDYDALIQEMYERAVAGETFEELAAEYKEDGYSVTSNTVTMGEDEYDTTIGPTCWEMETGDYATEYHDSTGWYVLYCENDFDEDATQTAIESELASRREAMFNEKYAELVDSVDTYVVHETIWANVTFDEAVYTGN